jgi:hypothetical protein
MRSENIGMEVKGMGAPHNEHAGARVHRRSTFAVAELRRQRKRRLRPSRSLRIALASALLALVALMGLVSAASATSAYDMRGEWQYTLTCNSCQGSTGTLLLKQMNFTTGAYSGTTVLDGVLDGTASGIVSGSSVSLKIILPDTPMGEYTFTVENGTIESAKNEFSGPGYYNSMGGYTGEIKAKQVRTQAQIEKEEQEAKEKQEKAEREAKEKAELEAKEKAEKEAAEKPIKEKAEREAKEKAEKEAQEKQAKETQEAKEKQAAKEAQEKQVKETQEAKEKQAAKEAQEAKEKQAKALTTQAPSAAGPAKPNTKTLAVSSSGIVSIELSDPNGYAISGEVTLSSAAAGKSSATKGKPKTAALAESPFSIASDATKLVKLKLSKSAAAALADHKSLRVAIKITTRATGHTSTTKTYSVTLQAPSRTKH